MRALIAGIFFILFCNMASAQLALQPPVINISQVQDSTLIIGQSLLFVDDSREINPAKLLQQDWQAMAVPAQKKVIPVDWIDKIIYLQFRLLNDNDSESVVYFFPGISYRSIKLYKVLNNGSVELQEDLSQGDGYQPIGLKTGETGHFIAELQFTKNRSNVMYPQVITDNFINKYQRIFYGKNYVHDAVGYVLSGILLMMMFFNAANFLLSRKKEFSYNFFYAACMFLLVLFNAITDRRGGVLTSLFLGYIDFALLVTGTVFYIAFTRKFLDTKSKYPSLNKFFKYSEIGLMTLLGCFTLIHFFTHNFLLLSLLETTMKFIALGIGILYIIIAYIKKDKLMNYLAAGNTILIVFSIASLMLILFPPTQYGIFTSPMIYYETGIVCELIFFLLGLTYKNRVYLIGTIKEQEALKLEAEKQAFETKLAILNAQQEERNRISADMHDDLGAGVTAIRLYSELAKTKMGSDTLPEIEKISSSANDLLNNMNGIIWTMNSNNDSLGNTVAYMRSYALEYFENTGINCNIKIVDGLPNIWVGGEIRRNVLLVIKEALNNILKHSKATTVHITLERTEDGLVLFIQDNGIGIDFENIRRFGNGLKNMKQRMAMSEIEFSIENNNGTLVTLRRQVDL